MVQVSVAPTEGVMKKKAYHHGDLRNAIIIEATARARSQGEKAIVLREIAAEIGVSATAAYRHFTNRRQLVEEVAARGFAAMGEVVAAAPVAGADVAPGDAADIDLRTACAALVGFTADEPCWSLMMIENLGGSEVVRDAAVPVVQHLQAIVERGIPAGSFRPGATVRGNRVFWAGIDGLASQYLFGTFGKGSEGADAATRRMIDLCTKDLLSDTGLAARAAATS